MTRGTSLPPSWSWARSRPCPYQLAEVVAADLDHLSLVPDADHVILHVHLHTGHGGCGHSQPNGVAVHQAGVHLRGLHLICGQKSSEGSAALGPTHGCPVPSVCPGVELRRCQLLGQPDPQREPPSHECQSHATVAQARALGLTTESSPEWGCRLPATRGPAVSTRTVGYGLGGLWPWGPGDSGRGSPYLRCCFP